MRDRGQGYFCTPTVVAGVEQHDEAIQNEIFAPVITVQPFSDEDEAVGSATGSSSAWPPASGPADHGRAMRVSGTWTSARSGSTPTCPWSPRCRTAGSSTPGYGKDLSVYGLEDYTRIKHVMHNINY